MIRVVRMVDRCLCNVTQDHSATTGVETHEAGEAGSSALNHCKAQALGEKATTEKHRHF